MVRLRGETARFPLPNPERAGEGDVDDGTGARYEPAG
jgi:hypothetical protein